MKDLFACRECGCVFDVKITKSHWEMDCSYLVDGSPIHNVGVAHKIVCPKCRTSYGILIQILYTRRNSKDEWRKFEGERDRQQDINMVKAWSHLLDLTDVKMLKQLTDIKSVR